MSDHEQLSLTTEFVDLTDTELAERGRRLAQLLREAELLEDDHVERKKEMGAERKALQAKIGELALVVRTGREERPKGQTRRQLGAGVIEHDSQPGMPETPESA